MLSTRCTSEADTNGSGKQETSEVDGWPVKADRLPLHGAGRAFTSGEVPGDGRPRRPHRRRAPAGVEGDLGPVRLQGRPAALGRVIAVPGRTEAPEPMSEGPPAPPSSSSTRHAMRAAKS